MKKVLSFSVLLNVVLFAGLTFVPKMSRPQESVVVPASSEIRPLTQTTTSSAQEASGAEPVSFCWSQLMSGKDYRRYVANLRAVGCPEVTIEDIVRGDTGRVFDRERSQLALDDTGTGPWSAQAEQQLVADLLRQPELSGDPQNAENPKHMNSGEMAVGASAPPADAQSGTADYPLFLQNVDWSALGFTADQQIAIAQVRQQFQGEMKGVSQPPASSANANPNPTAGEPGSTPSNSRPTETATPTPGQTAWQSADDQLLALLGVQGYERYKQQQYYAWYQPQVLASADGGNLNINPGAFSSK